MTQDQAKAQGEIEAELRWMRDVGIVGRDARLQAASRRVRLVADTTCTVLITGESGTGKEVMAQAVHRASPRRNGAFVAINCAAIPDTLIESELFGHVKGAFTGATGPREGKILASSGGTLFLDEIGDMPLPAQAKLLRVLQEQQVVPVGSDQPIPVDIRIVAATHQKLEQLVKQGRFRADLFYRLGVIPVHLPALRERGDDILLLAEHFVRHYSVKHGRPGVSFSKQAVNALRTHAWPGNVRELSNAVERAVLLCFGDSITPCELGLGQGDDDWAEGTCPGIELSSIVPDDGNLDLRVAIDNVERRLIRTALDRSGGNRTEAAALLGLNRTTLVEKIKKLA